MPETLQSPPDWFDAVWSKHEKDLPIYLRGQKKLARQILGGIVESLGEYAKTPEGMQQIVAFARVSSMVRGVAGVLDAPDPSPNQVADAVERLVKRFRP
jgi:hypothetical protein